MESVLRLKEILREIRARIRPTGPVSRRITHRDIPDIRSEVAQKLASAINEVDSIARSSAKRTRKGSGGIAPKARWYALMAQLAQVLDGVLHNVSLNEIDDKLESLESSVEELQDKTPSA